MCNIMKRFLTQHKARSYWLGIVVLLAVLTTSGALCGGQNLTPLEAVSLEIWRSEDTEADLSAAMAAYAGVYPHVSFTYRQLKEEEYEDELFKAWSKGEGPDIFSIPNSHVGKYVDFITTMPDAVALKTAHMESNFGKKEVVTEVNNIVFPTASQLQDQYVQAVTDDVVIGDKVYGLPMSIDTLGLYYNRELLAKAQIAIPPQTWEEFRDAVQIMTELDDERNIVRPAAALGTAENVPYFFDIVSVLMMQNGATMTSKSGRVTFNAGTEEGRKPAEEALDFYTKFSNQQYKTYTWNDEQMNALETFTQGNLGFYFGYLSDNEVIEKRAPNLNYSYTYLPQIDPNNFTNYPRYAVETVHIGCENPEHAWNFIRFIASEQQVGAYLESTFRVSALKSIVNDQQTDPERGVFAQQALTAKTWYHGFDPGAAAAAFQEMIDTTNEHTTPIEEVINLAVSKVRLTVQEE